LEVIPFPMPPGPDTLAAGKTLYDKNCAACHGTELAGDGPGAAASAKPPRDFTDCAAMQEFDLLTHHDAVVNGRPAGGMPAWGGNLSDTEIWQVIMYERSPCQLFMP
jgi:high-affinity iron transporter